MGPFGIQKKIGIRELKLELFLHMKVLPVYHKSLLKPYGESKDPK